MTLIDINDETVVVEHIQKVTKVNTYIPNVFPNFEEQVSEIKSLKKKPKYMIAGFIVKIKKGESINVNFTFADVSIENRKASDEALQRWQEKKKKLDFNFTDEQMNQMKEEYNNIMKDIAMPEIVKVANEKRDKILKKLEETKAPDTI